MIFYLGFCKSLKMLHSLTSTTDIFLYKSSSISVNQFTNQKMFSPVRNSVFAVLVLLSQVSAGRPVITEALYNSLFLHKDNSACPAKDFYPYNAFIEATKSFSSFGNQGSPVIQRREVAAFLAQVSQETTGGWATAPDGPYAWGLCFKEEISPNSNYCDTTNVDWPCAANKTYKGRGPIQLSWNYNYGPAGKALGFDGLANPETVSNNSVIAFKTALWFWMTEQKPKPSCHAVMTGKYRLTEADRTANRTLGYGLTTNIINGGLECGRPGDARVNGRIGFFQRYAQLFNVSTGPNLDCGNQKSF